jgi:hypothetical protein
VRVTQEIWGDECVRYQVMLGMNSMFLEWEHGLNMA